MDYLGIFNSIKPDLTLYSVLITLAIVAFAFGRFFWKYEKQLDEENIERIKDLLNSYRQKYIDPIISLQLRNALDDGYTRATHSLIADLYPKSPTSDERERVLCDEVTLKDIIKLSHLQERLNTEKQDRNFYFTIGKYLGSDSGETFFDSLDHLYEQRNKLSVCYDYACKYSAKCSYAFFVLTILLFLGILQLIGRWPDTLLYFWIFFSIQAFLFGIYYFIRVEVYRRELLRIWKELQLYGKI